MKYITKALLGLGLLAAASGSAFAADASIPDVVTTSGWYLRGDAGWSWLNGDDSELAVGGGVGYKYSDNLRADLRADYAGIGDKDNHFGSVLGNVYFDIPTETIFTPYLGAGVGYGWASTGGADDDGAAFALMTGFEVNLTDNLSADVGYRYRQILGDDAHDHEALVGLRFGF